ncbi:hypothetical protein MLD38_008443 [Melastoma candidum]|uniref:Uncharacterized protein n=1 Tax=Melastoma candidum TaxID=119954 RepID=A0ACB9RTT2_9MYRT|nr:hypothetical protein MLD38_008443 [Melastoma candidum]
MEETGIIRLDPRAQEFRPRSSSSSTFLSLHLPPPLPSNPNPSFPFFPSFLPPPPQPQPLFDAAPSPSPPFLPPPLPMPPPFPDPYCNFPHPPPPPHPHAPSRAVVLSLLPPDVSETAVRRELEMFGEVRAVEMDWVGDGVVTVHFYDLRHAKRAVREIREQHDRGVTPPREDGFNNHPFMRGRFSGGRRLFGGRPVWAQFVIPVASCIPEGQNQGTIVIFNLDPASSTDELRRIFEAFGPVKELRDTPYKKHQRFVEFYDARDASRALREMNGKEINGRSVVIEFSRPGGFSRKLLNAAAAATAPSSSTFPNPILNFTSASCYPARTTNSPSQHHPEPLPLRQVHPQQKFPENEGCSFGNEGLFIEGSMCNLSLDIGSVRDVSGAEELGVGARMTGKKKLGGNKQGQQLKGKNWKGKRQEGKVDSRFAITDDSMEEPRSSGDSRTTIMIKNIPNKYSQKLLLSMLDNHCIHTNEEIDVGGGQQPFSSYDFVYLPIDFNNKCNVGYGFVNMTTPEAARRLYKAFHRRHWEVFNSRKICEVTYARIQGVEALREHFKNSKFPHEMDLYLPVVFSPPRDGRTLTEPSPVVGRANQQLCEGGSDPGANNSSDGEDQLGLDLGIGSRSSGSGSRSHSVSRQSSDGGGGVDDMVK